MHSKDLVLSIQQFVSLFLTINGQDQSHYARNIRFAFLIFHWTWLTNEVQKRDNIDFEPNAKSYNFVKSYLAADEKFLRKIGENTKAPRKW